MSISCFDWIDYRLSNYLDCIDYGLLMAELLLV